MWTTVGQTYLLTFCRHPLSPVDGASWLGNSLTFFLSTAMIFWCSCLTTSGWIAITFLLPPILITFPSASAVPQSPVAIYWAKETLLGWFQCKISQGSLLKWGTNEISVLFLSGESVQFKKCWYVSLNNVNVIQITVMYKFNHFNSVQ